MDPQFEQQLRGQWEELQGHKVSDAEWAPVRQAFEASTSKPGRWRGKLIENLLSFPLIATAAYGALSLSSVCRKRRRPIPTPPAVPVRTRSPVWSVTPWRTERSALRWWRSSGSSWIPASARCSPTASSRASGDRRCRSPARPRVTAERRLEGLPCGDRVKLVFGDSHHQLHLGRGGRTTRRGARTSRGSSGRTTTCCIGGDNGRAGHHLGGQCDGDDLMSELRQPRHRRVHERCGKMSS